MSFWKSKDESVKVDVAVSVNGESIRTVTAEAKDSVETKKIVSRFPPPDLSTKPPDKVGYCFGFVCANKHVSHPFDKATVDDFKERRACQTCGGVAKPATVRRISEARWVDNGFFSISKGNIPNWGWSHYYTQPGSDYMPRMIKWTYYEFLAYLEGPKPAVKRRKK